MKNKRMIITGLLTLIVMIFSAGAAPVSAQSDVCDDTYVVQPGDYLTLIADRCDVSYSALLDANPQIEIPRLIYPGQVVNIPDTQDGDVPIPVTGGSVYIVQPGDSLSEIAARFGLTTGELLNANPELSRNQIVRSGQLVRLPEGAARVPTASITPNTARAGSLITVAVTGFRANTAVVYGLQQVGEGIQQLGQATTDANGAFYRSVRLPQGLDMDERYQFIVMRADNANVRAVSNTIYVTGEDGAEIPVTGPDYYVVQPGDSLSEIAVRYNLTVAELLDLNPEIENPNRIYTGQRIDLPSDVQPATAWVSVSDRVVEPGEEIQVQALNFPANAIVDVRLVPVGESREAIVDARTDSNGELIENITVPDDADDGEEWVAIVTTTERADIVRATSQPFVIDE